MAAPATLKQLETMFWIAELGTFERASMRLNTTQSAISKRVQELEANLGAELFDRSLRGARLTQKGEYIVELAREMLELHARIDEIRDGSDAPVRRVRFGITELIAATWLPRMVTQLRAAYPGAMLEPEVDMSRSLYEKLLDDQIDLIIITETFSAPEVSSVRLAEVENAWMARPGLVPDPQAVLSLGELAQYPILSQGGRSGTGLFFHKWMRNKGIVFPREISSDSMTALLGMTIAGLGVTYMPRDFLSGMIDAGKLAVIKTTPQLPPVPYSAMYRNDRPSAFTEDLVRIARISCDFSSQFQIDAPEE
ncbi:LysR family transcriptional regulator [Roseovarius sp.]|uniref:LysR family transcriptional regulator n=1 Tax=Roseovarius sp. TaxID=1486281 RepID=UPI000C4C1A75|nr:LysR family transcriptional regulator [Roseovarius sp.]MAO28089.1 LysR family transcriptional regulator [Roseovarius sp.]MAZ20988.1 LysR family transcriptional regulator [Roseovarius sp.]